MTGKEMSEYISESIKIIDGKDISPEEIWNSDPNGELSGVFEMYHMYKCIREKKVMIVTLPSGDIRYRDAEEGEEPGTTYIEHETY